ncbi:extracellular serine-rich protein [Cordyceps militaris CM01]|uniref:Extracellular serine-rich protein n=2 Tax=Cordyceps militaris TaxID=73501 RepID=G3JS59_CORMM|nr:extracellular serine-rich protein [Cordyceps militaris CM01]ATY63149.1 extracellular serine-rich [Cordyceps militaris]EGX88705.1 extracellular serine-rich protein [Cordyceps militaris CM01]
MRATTAILAIAAGVAQAKTVHVDVGKDGLNFTPSVMTAAKGDTLLFHFYPQRHSVVLGTKDKPCEPATTDMFYSGFVPSSNGEASETFMVTVNSTDAMYLYCSQAKHCQGGMVAVVNGDEAALDTYKEAAAKATDNVSPKEVTGGMLMSGSGSATSGSESGATSTSGAGASKTSAAASGSSAKPAAAAGFKASVAGVLAAAGGVAALML